MTYTQVALLAVPVLMAADLLGLWVMYFALSHLAKIKKQVGLTPAMERLGKVVYVIGWLWDVRVNWTTFAFLTICLALDFPQEATVTSHLSRMKHAGGWKARISGFVCDDLGLNRGDPSGCHCK